MNTTISIPKSTKARAQKVAKKYDMSVSAVARILLNDFASGRIQIATVVPTRNIPNAETERVLRETDQGKDLNYVENPAKLFEELGI